METPSSLSSSSTSSRPSNDKLGKLLAIGQLTTGLLLTVMAVAFLVWAPYLSSTNLAHFSGLMVNKPWSYNDTHFFPVWQNKWTDLKNWFKLLFFFLFQLCFTGWFSVILMCCFRSSTNDCDDNPQRKGRINNGFGIGKRNIVSIISLRDFKWCLCVNYSSTLKYENEGDIRK